MIVDLEHPLSHKTHIFDDKGVRAGRVQSIDTKKHEVTRVASEKDGSIKFDLNFDMVIETVKVSGWTYSIDGAKPKKI